VSKLLGGARRAAALSEKTGTHHARTEGDDAERDQQPARVLAIAVRSSAAAVIVASSAARRPTTTFHLRH
jgi:hypothetical protein